MKAPSPLIVSIGDPKGVGSEVILKSWLERDANALPAFAVMGGADHLTQLTRKLALDVPIAVVEPDDARTVFPASLPVIELAQRASDNPDAALTVASIETAIEGVFKGDFSGLVTAPINKKALYDSGFDFPGHTEFLAELATRHAGGEHHSVMMLAGPDLRTVPVTVHIPLDAVPQSLTSDLIMKVGRIVANDLANRFGIERPRLTFSGLNPHAGEEGAMGHQDVGIIAPAVTTLQSEGIDARGPLPADTMFHAAARQTYDVAICMYHDQALIPAKTLAFDDAVNVTLGLPFIRTSPDHGTAYNIAGRGEANPSSMIAAIKMAGEMAARNAASTTWKQPA